MKSINNINQGMLLLFEKNNMTTKRIIKLEQYVSYLENKIYTQDSNKITDLQNKRNELQTEIIKMEEQLKRLNEQLNGNGLVKYNTENSFETSAKPVNNFNNDPGLLIFHCEFCGLRFKEEGLLNNHVMSHQRNDLVCNKCNLKFKEHFRLEEHIDNVHCNDRVYKCEKCEKEFNLNWRLKKHKRIHDGNSHRKCHYFNNGKICPFEKRGCKFLHENSENCIHKENCSFQNCQYTHL